MVEARVSTTQKRVDRDTMRHLRGKGGQAQGGLRGALRPSADGCAGAHFVAWLPALRSVAAALRSVAAKRGFASDPGLEPSSGKQNKPGGSGQNDPLPRTPQTNKTNKTLKQSEHGYEQTKQTFKTCKKFCNCRVRTPGISRVRSPRTYRVRGPDKED